MWIRVTLLRTRDSPVTVSIWRLIQNSVSTFFGSSLSFEFFFFKFLRTKLLKKSTRNYYPWNNFSVCKELNDQGEAICKCFERSRSIDWLIDLTLFVGFVFACTSFVCVFFRLYNNSFLPRRSLNSIFTLNIVLLETGRTVYHGRPPGAPIVRGCHGGIGGRSFGWTRCCWLPSPFWRGRVLVLSQLLVQSDELFLRGLRDEWKFHELMRDDWCAFLGSTTGPAGNQSKTPDSGQWSAWFVPKFTRCGGFITDDCPEKVVNGLH